MINEQQSSKNQKMEDSLMVLSFNNDNMSVQSYPRVHFSGPDSSCKLPDSTQPAGEMKNPDQPNQT